MKLNDSITVRVTDEQKNKLQMQADAQGIFLSDILKEMIADLCGEIGREKSIPEKSIPEKQESESKEEKELDDLVESAVLSKEKDEEKDEEKGEEKGEGKDEEEEIGSLFDEISTDDNEEKSEKEEEEEEEEGGSYLY